MSSAIGLREDLGGGREVAAAEQVARKINPAMPFNGHRPHTSNLFSAGDHHPESVTLASDITHMRYSPTYCRQHECCAHHLGSPREVDFDAVGWNTNEKFRKHLVEMRVRAVGVVFGAFRQRANVDVETGYAGPQFLGKVVGNTGRQ